MGLEYRDLDERTRTLMLEEIDRDAAGGSLFLSDNLTAQGKAEYPELLRAAAQDGNDDTLASEIRRRLNAFEKPRQLKSGRFSKAPEMRRNAHEMLAEGEFNRFYIRALCRRAIEDGKPQLIVYRAKAVEKPRSASEAMIGQALSAEDLLRDLRDHPGVDTAMGLPSGPNSGLSAHLV